MFEHILFLHKRSRLVVWWLVSIVFFKTSFKRMFRNVGIFLSFLTEKYDLDIAMKSHRYSNFSSIIQNIIL